MNLTLHLIGKDFLYLRLYLSVWWGLVILQAIFVGSYPQDFLGEWRWEVPPSFLLHLFAVLEICLLTVDHLSTGAEGLNRRKHRLLVKPPRIRQAVVGEQAIVPASYGGSSRPCGTGPPAARAWSHVGRYSPLLSTDGFSAVVPYWRGHDAGVLDLQPSKTDLAGAHCTGGTAPPLVYVVVSVCCCFLPGEFSGRRCAYCAAHPHFQS